MRIGMMLRSYDEKGGVGVYTRNLVKELLSFDRRNHYILFYRRSENLGEFSEYGNVAETVVKGYGKAFWDQVAIPCACRRHKVDVVFNPKFTTPLLAPCKAVMVVHGADWFLEDQARFYHPLDVRYIRTIMPWYFRKASAVLSVSQLTTDNFNTVLKLPAGKVRTVYFAPARHFRRITNKEILRRMSEKYHLPERFILTLTKPGGTGRKNLGKILEAYGHYHALSAGAARHKLVIGGKDCSLLREEYRIPQKGYGADVHFPGWIDQQDLPAVYALAGLFLYPSNLEAFPIPITEAMACGCPIVTSNANGLKEIAGDAAFFVNPQDNREIAEAIGRVLQEPQLRGALSEKGLARSQIFSWEKCVRETLAILEQVGAIGKAGNEGGSRENASKTSPPF